MLFKTQIETFNWIQINKISGMNENTPKFQLNTSQISDSQLYMSTYIYICTYMYLYTTYKYYGYFSIGCYVFYINHITQLNQVSV